MDARIRLLGAGHAVGSEVISNSELALSMGLSEDWLTRRTGILERRVNAAGETAVGFAADSIRAACRDAGLSPEELGGETLLLHVQSGCISYVPPIGTLICSELGAENVRVLGIDGACAEPLVALDLAQQQLAAGRCRRVIVSAATDILPMIDPSDPATVGLFGSGGAAIMLGMDDSSADDLIRGLHWESHSQHWELGEAKVQGFRQQESGFSVDHDYYSMAGQSLARVALDILPEVVAHTLEQADWKHDEVELVLAHQPNVRMLELGAKRLGFPVDIVPMPVRRLGNLGAASLLVNLSTARSEGRLPPGAKVLLLAFGLGFSCGAAAIQV